MSREGLKLTSDPLQLPPRIRDHLEQAGILGDGLLAAVKTAYKPNSTIPTLWLVIHKNGIAFCCTHRTRGIFKQYHRSEVDSVRISEASGLGPPIVEVISAELGEDDFSIPLPTEVELGRLRKLLASAGYQVLN